MSFQDRTHSCKNSVHVVRVLYLIYFVKKQQLLDLLGGPPVQIVAQHVCFLFTFLHLFDMINIPKEHVIL